MKETQRKEPETTQEGGRKIVCRYWLEIERCSQCVLETLCAYEDMKKRNMVD